MPDWTREISQRLELAGQPVDADVLEELAQHAAALHEAARADGASRAEAATAVDNQIAVWTAEAPALRRRPRRPAAPVPPPAESRSWSTGLVQDVRYAARLFRRHAPFSLLVVCTMAAGIAATTVLVSVTYGVLMKPLPWSEADRLVVLEETRGGHRPRFNAFSNAAYLSWRDQAETVEAIAAWAPRTFTLSTAGDPERIRAVAGTASLFPVLRVRPLIGSVFEARDEAAERGPVVVLSERLWRERFDGDPAILGRLVPLDGTPHLVIGVLPDGAAYPERETRAWVPLRIDPTTGNFLSMFEAIARLRPGATPAQAAAEGTARGRSAPQSPDMDMVVRAIFGGLGPIEVAAQPLRDALTADVRRPLIVLLVAVGLLFATATANVASLQLARATTRRREMAIRAALGAGAARVTRQLLLENLLLGIAGGFVGLVITVLLHRLLPSLLPADFPRVSHLALDAPVVAFALAASVLASIAFGLLPALRARRLDLVGSLSEDGSALSGVGAGSRVARARLLIMTGQVAIACVLLIGAGLLGRSFLALVSADRGFDPANVLTARVHLPRFAYGDTHRAGLVESLTRRVRDLPGVTAVTYIDGPPLGASGGTAFMIESRQVQAAAYTIGPGYFAAMGTRILDGRDFTDDDISASRRVLIVNQAFARLHLAGAAAGRHVRGWVRKGPESWEIIAIVEDVRHRGVSEPPEPAVYLYRSAESRRAPTAPTFIIRTAGDPASFAPTFRALVKHQDPTVVVDGVMTMEDRLLTGLAQPRLYAVLLGGFAGLALFIAAIGLFGVLSYTVAQRSRELAVRTALGARPADIIRLVLLQGLGITAVGVAVGLPAAFLATAAIGRLLYGVGHRDALTFFVVPIVILIVAAAACVSPARRASRIDPLRALKSPP